MRGFCEAVERDATAIWWYNQLVLPRIDSSSLADELALQYETWLQSQDRELRLLRLTLDLPIPVVAAISHHVSGGAVAFGFGAGTSMSEAARRAVGELAQCEANLALLKRHASLAGTGGFTPEARRLYKWHEESDIHHHEHLAGGAVVGASPEELQLDWPLCLDICREHGLTIVAVDLTHRDDKPLARVFVPGFRSIKPRVRLRQAP